MNSARMLVIQPGDLLVFESPYEINEEQAEAIKARLRSHSALTNFDVCVLGMDSRLGVVRVADEAAPTA